VYRGLYFFLLVFLGLGHAASRVERWRPVAFGIAFFVIALIPTSVVPLAEMTNDHRMFFPFVGLTLAVVWTLYLLLEKQLEQVPRTAMIAIALFICLGYAFGTYQRNKVWYLEETLWKDVTEKGPHNGRALMNYALIFIDTRHHSIVFGLYHVAGSIGERDFEEITFRVKPYSYMSLHKSYPLCHSCT
jgi:Ca2+/Na+ antiporter